MFPNIKAESQCYRIATFESAGLIELKNADVVFKSRENTIHIDGKRNMTRDKEDISMVSWEFQKICHKQFGSINVYCWGLFNVINLQISKTLQLVNKVYFETLTLQKQDWNNFDSISLSNEVNNEQRIEDVFINLQSKKTIKEIDIGAAKENILKWLVELGNVYKYIKIVSFNDNQRVALLSLIE